MFVPGGQPFAAAAAAIATVANVGSAILAKPPPARGSVTQTTIGTDQPSCELLGRTYSPGARVHLTGYGAPLKKVQNPYLLAVDVVSVGGPLEACETLMADMAPIGGYFAGFLWQSIQLGQQYEASALALHYAWAPGWGANARLSGKAAIAWNALFDKDGKVFASGLPALGSVWRGVKAYDPRKDDTYPGGMGPHRWADPRDTAAFDAARATWEYTTSPGLLALRNVLGTWERDTTNPASTYRKVFGVGMPIDGLIVGDFVHLANVCDANGWDCGGRIFEPGNRWDNLKRILQAGGAQPAWRGGLLGIQVQAPRIALDTITADDLADGEVVIGAMQGWEQRLNTLSPKFRSEAHRWEPVATTEPVQIAAQLAEDGEEKLEERQFELVQDATQARQLCAYELMDRRELGDIELPCKPRLRRYGPGDLLIVDLPEAGLIAQPAVVMKRSLDPVTMAVTFTLRGETIVKHGFALGLTGTAPPTPALRSTADLDGVAAPVAPDRAAYLIVRQSVAYPIESDATSITIAAFDATIDDGRVLTFPAQTIEDLDSASTYLVLWDLTAGAFVAVSAPALTEVASSNYVIIRQTTTANGDGTYPSDPTPPGGDGGGGYGGGGCPITTAPILLANAARTGPGKTIAAGEIEAGAWVWSRHETTGEWGAYRVTSARTFESDLVAVAGRPLTSPSHIWGEVGAWTHADTIGTPAGRGLVVALSVADARTYVIVGDDGTWLPSHNKQATEAS